MARYVSEIQVPAAGDEIACPALSGMKRPLVLLALGQSNAGNHGSRGARAPNGALWYAGHCYPINDPLAGGTGFGGSIWSRLAMDLDSGASTRSLLLVVLAVDSSRVSDWLSDGPLHDRFEQMLAALRANRIDVSAVLWQQGEADARDNVSRDRYAASLSALVDDLHAGGVSAPVLVAYSTRCRSAGSPAIRDAIALVAARRPNVHLGPDTDALGFGFRSDGCHFNRVGLERAAQLWLDSLRGQHVIPTSSESTRIGGEVGK